MVFGIGHAYQGNSAIVGTAVIGLLNGLVYLRKRNAVEAIAVHAVFDILVVAGGALMNSGH
ncbi:MAG: CPBP family intramembrane glutamic endopeptidase [Bacteroidota bacterium]